jgi:hypothetical protein
MADIRNATWDLCLIQQLNTYIKQNENKRWLLSTFDKAVKETLNLAVLKYDESDDQYFRRLERIYAEMWGRKNKYGDELLKKYRDLVYDEERNIERNSSSEYVLKTREEVDKEFRGISGTLFT